MPNMLIVAASANGTSSASASLARDLAERRAAEGFAVDWCILADEPAPPLDAAFVSAAFAPPGERDASMRQALAYSDAQIASLRRADVLVIATPMYNFGIPGLLKSWFDQIVRPGETFSMTGDRDAPYRGLLSISECIAIVTRGSHAFSPSGDAADWNFLDRHLEAMLGLIGIDQVRFVDCSGLDEDRCSAEAILSESRKALLAA